MDRVAVDTVDKPVEHMVDVDVVVTIGVEDVVNLLKRHRITIYLWLAVKLPHSLVEEEERREPQIL